MTPIDPPISGSDVSIKDLYDDDHEQALLVVILAALYVAMLKAARRTLLPLVGLKPSSVKLTKELLDLALQRATGRAAMISGSTRATLTELTLSTDDADALLARIETLYRETWANRPALIAANEAHNGALTASQDIWMRSGEFDRQLVRDGRDFDAACRERDGTTVAIDTPVYQLHPGCRVQTRPLRPDDVTT